MCLQAHKLTGLWVFGLLLLCLNSQVSAAIHACTTADGTTVFQDRPCARTVPVESKKMVATRSPLGIHESWFIKPAQNPNRPFCDNRGCECGKFQKSHNGSLALAVADALYIDASWHHYDLTEEAWLDTPVKSSQRYDRHSEMVEASCMVLMSQQILKQFAEDTAAKLRLQARHAEERGYDIPDVCDSGDMVACEYYDALMLYQRMSKDAKALHLSRDNISNDNFSNDKELPLYQ